MSDPTTIDRHEPERADSRLDAVAPAGCCCCCCCCCCLHTVGGLIGGVMGSVKELQPTRPVRFNDDDDDDLPSRFRRDAFEEDPSLLPVPLVYWLLVLFLGAVTAGVTFLNDSQSKPETLVLGGVLAVMILPGLQLGASLLTAVIVLIFYPNKELPLRRVGWITLLSFAGAMIGLTLIGGCCGVFLLPGMMR